MICPYCKEDNDHVLDSRPMEGSSAIRRRRECVGCNRRFTTYERLEDMPLMVIKSSNRREPFDRNKLREGIMRACEKRPVPIDTIERIVSEVEYEIGKDFVLQIHSHIIGDKILTKLTDIDHVAFIRFASVYRNFSDIQDFMRELRNLQRRRSQRVKKLIGGKLSSRLKTGRSFLRKKVVRIQKHFPSG